MKKLKHDQFLVKEDDDYLLYLGNPCLKSTSKVNVNMVLKIGIAIGENSVEDIIYEEMENLNN